MSLKGLVLSGKTLYDNTFGPTPYKKKLSKTISTLCEDNSYILDYGCDSGLASSLIMKYNPSLRIVGIDIQENRPSKIPRKIFDGERIPYEDNTFDIVIVLDVLHHTRNISKQLRELKRVTKKYIIIKDHISYGWFSEHLLSCSDFITNLPNGVTCEFNFPRLSEWESMFKDNGLKLIGKPQMLNLGNGIIEKYNPIFKLKKDMN
ncbi:MAG: class I SAM-dependent methyltransferase [archaeon]